MNVTMVAPFGLRPKGTVRVRALPLATALVARGHRVTLLVPPWDDRSSAGQSFEQDGVQVEQLPLPPTPGLDVPWLTGYLLRRTRGTRPHVVHTFKPKAYSGFVAAAWWLIRQLRRARAPLVVDSDDWEGPGGWNDHAPYGPLEKRLFAWQERWGLRHTDGVTVASRALERLVLAMGVPRARVLYVPNGPGARWPSPAPDEVAALRARLALDDGPVALLFTRFVEFSPEGLARRWAAVVAQLPAARLLVVGSGLAGEEQAFHAALAAHRAEGSVVDVGWQPFDALPALFALAHVALYPMADTLLNRAKCPVKLADYLEAGLPVVGESVGQVAEYLGEGGGLVVPPGDDEAFVAATLHLLRQPQEAAALGRAGQVRLRTHFDWPMQAQRVEALYEALQRRSG